MDRTPAAPPPLTSLALHLRELAELLGSGSAQVRILGVDATQVLCDQLGSLASEAERASQAWPRPAAKNGR